jgi:hypothetical protein
MKDSDPTNRPLTPELVQALSALSGIELSPERAEALVPQAEQQLGLLRTLDASEVSVEPAGELWLDRTGGVQ